MRSLAYDPKYALNAICPYFTMFPLEYPLGILEDFKHLNPIVFDPFCGRGTTLYAARIHSLQAYGIDTSPIAVAIAKAKLATAKKEDIIGLAEGLLSTKPKIIPSNEFFKHAYSINTLEQICSIREGLMNLSKDSNESVLLKATMLGCLHGPINKIQKSYFSNQMPRTFSTKPDYSVRFWKNKGMEAPNIDVIQVIDKKLDRIKEIQEEGEFMGSVVEQDARNFKTGKELPNDFSLVITSPPYFGMNTYVEDQWLRNWFLGGPENVEYSNTEQLTHTNADIFSKELSMVWKRLSESRSDKLDLFIRFGNIPSKKGDAKEILTSSVFKAGDWKLISIKKANISKNAKIQSKLMGKTGTISEEYDFHFIRS